MKKLFEYRKTLAFISIVLAIGVGIASIYFQRDFTEGLAWLLLALFIFNANWIPIKD